MEFFSSWLGMGIMLVLLLALIGVYIYLQKRPQDD
jgi:hypothetical protein